MVTNRKPRKTANWIALAAGLVLSAGLPPVFSQQPAGSPDSARGTTPDAVSSLIQRLVEKGVLEANDAKELAALSGDSNVVVRLINRLANKGVLETAEATNLLASAKKESQAVEAHAEQSTQELPAPVAGEVRVTYIPEVVRSQIRDELRQEVMSQARQERWADPRMVPDWVQGMDVDADLRIRWEAMLYPEGNVNTGAFPDFNRINTGDPFDVAGSVFSPQQNVDTDRNRFRLRARFGFESDLGNNWVMGMGLATGSDTSPVTTNQTLGSGGGNFSKYQLWLDKAYLAYQTSGDPDRDLEFVTGRFENPFLSTDILFDPDLRFDGFAVLGRTKVNDWLAPFATAGVFPVFNSALNFATNNPAKFSSYNKFLYAIQGGLEFDLDKDMKAKVAVGYYNFDDVQGKRSSPFDPLVDLAGDTDESRPSFAQKGNSYFPLRNISRFYDLNGDPLPQEQYFGLASPFQLLSLSGRIDLNHFDPVQISLQAEFIRNVAWNPADVEALGVINNRGPDDPVGNLGPYIGGDTAWITQVVFGSAAFEQAGDWRVGIGYKRIESDAVMDAFNDSDFGMGGTNLEGFTLSGAIALQKKLTLGLSWLSADSIVGPKFSNDVFQVDLSQKF